MATTASRTVLDWFRSWANTRLGAIGRTDITSNMNLPLTSDVRVQAALAYVNQIEADARALFDPSWEPFVPARLDDVTASRLAMPPAVAADFASLWADADPDVLALLKGVIRSVFIVELAHDAGVT